MILNQVLYTALQALAGGRVYPDEAPQGGALPYVTYRTMGENWTHGHDRSTSLIGNRMVQFDAYAETQDAAWTLADQICTTLNGLTTSTLNRAFVRERLSLPEQDTRLFRISIDAELWGDLIA